MKRKIYLICVMLFLVAICAVAQEATRIPIPKIDLGVSEAQSPQEVALSLQILFLLSILTLAPSIMVLTTSFLRIAIVFDFIKKALSLQQVPPNQIVFGLALFLTLFIMWPTFEQINNRALQPFINQDSLPANERLTINEFYENLADPLRVYDETNRPTIYWVFMNMKFACARTYDDIAHICASACICD